MDELLEIAYGHEAEIRLFYDRFADRRPVMLYDVQEQRIYAYPYREFTKELSPRSQAVLKKQYSHAKRNDQMVLFVRDNDQRRLVSFSWDL